VRPVMPTIGWELRHNPASCSDDHHVRTGRRPLERKAAAARIVSSETARGTQTSGT
jgi:hypothetical protein